MKYKLYIKTIITGVLLSVFVFSCTDDFVEVSPEYSIDSENYFNSEDDYYYALISAYDLLQTTYQNVLVGEIASPLMLCGGEKVDDVIGWRHIADMNHTPVNDNLHEIWNRMFAGVQRSNYFMEFKDNIDFEGKEKMIGEVRFLRAYYYFELVKWFGPVPLKVDKRFEVGDEESIPRASVSDVYEQIEKDLIYAISVLDYTTPEAGRATKGSAQALLGKAYLYQEKFTEAASILDTLITEGPYYLVTDYASIWEDDGENGPESVFEVQYTHVEGGSYDYMQGVEGNIMVGFSGPYNYEGPVFASGNRFGLPTQEAVDAFDANDLRLDVTILDMDAWVAETGATYTPGYEHTGYFNRKYIPRAVREGQLPDVKLTHPNNYRAIRYSDVLLMAAEAYNRGNIDDSKAQTYLNEVRRRAFGDTNHDITATGTALTDAIYYERSVELMGEGHYFFDLVRTGRAADKIDGFVAGKNEVFPIPLEEIQFSNGNWQQNPNY